MYVYDLGVEEQCTLNLSFYTGDVDKKSKQESRGALWVNMAVPYRHHECDELSDKWEWGQGGCTRRAPPQDALYGHLQLERTKYIKRRPVCGRDEEVICAVKNHDRH